MHSQAQMPPQTSAHHNPMKYQYFLGAHRQNALYLIFSRIHPENKKPQSTIPWKYEKLLQEFLQSLS